MPPKKGSTTAAAARAYPGRGEGSAWPLAQKYAPRSVAELVVYPKTTQRVKEWLASQFSSGGERGGVPSFSRTSKLLVVAGRPGIGKSTMVDAVCKELGVEIWRWRSLHGLGGTGGPGGYESHVEQFRQAMRGQMCASLSSRKTALVLEEWPDPAYCGDELRATLRTLATRSERPAILVVSDGVTEKSEAKLAVDALLGEDLANDVEVVEVNAVTELKIEKRLQAVAKAERAKGLSDGEIADIAKEADGDLRAALNTLEFRLRRSDDDIDDHDFFFPSLTKRQEKQRRRGVDDDDEDEKKTKKKQKKPDPKKDDDDAYRLAGDVVSDLHAISRLLNAKRDEGGALQFDPERVSRRAKMGPDAVASFVQFNGIAFFADEAELFAFLNDLSEADLLVARMFSTTTSTAADSTFPLAYVGSVVGRTAAARRKHPAPSAFRPIRKPRLYDVLRVKKPAFRGLLAPRRGAFDFDAPPAIRRTFFGEDDGLGFFRQQQDRQDHDDDVMGGGGDDDDDDDDDDYGGILPEDDIVEV